jgi:hypothetical protein
MVSKFSTNARKWSLLNIQLVYQAINKSLVMGSRYFIMDGEWYPMWIPIFLWGPITVRWCGEICAYTMQPNFRIWEILGALPRTRYSVKDRGTTRGGVNGSEIKFFARIGLCPKFKTLDNHYTRRWWKHFPTTETWYQQNDEASGRRMRSIKLMVSKVHLK